MDRQYPRYRRIAACHRDYRPHQNGDDSWQAALCSIDNPAFAN